MAAPSTAPAEKPAYSPGLEGVIAGESAICSLDSEAGLRYRGYDIYDLATQATFPEIVYLLIHGELPNKQQLEAFQKQIVPERALPDGVLQMLRLLPKNTHPMDALRTGVSMLAGFDPELSDNAHDTNVRKAYRIIPKMANITCAFQRLSEGQEPIAPRPELGTSANFLWMLTGKEPEEWRVRVMDHLFALYAEHDYNASTFAARVTASTLADMYCAITSAIGALKGPLHGGANEEAMKMFLEVKSPERAEPWVKERLAKKEKIMGFGHRVYKHGDSRSKVLHKLAADIGQRLNQPHWVLIGEALEKTMEKEKGLFSNADLYAAPVFYMLGIPSDLNTPIFACSRASGWCAHVIEQHDKNRLIRPRGIYIGSPARAYKPLAQR
ncbi:MAG: citrate synthase [Anaerolineae bacterium]|nr:citrate synthase [Phycisphaerae bacterium]